MSNQNLDQLVLTIAQQAQNAADKLTLLNTQAKNEALRAIAKSLHQYRDAILIANKLDLELASNANLPTSMIDRLELTPKRITDMITGIESIASLADPVGEIIASWKRPNGLNIAQVRIPLGVIGVIYESRPNVTIDSAALCLKSGNAVILRPGTESFNSSMALLAVIHHGLEKTGIPNDTVQMIPTKKRKAIDKLAQLDQYIDVIIPRGGPSLIKHLSKISKVPLFKHLAGLCHTYIHRSADIHIASHIVLNAKMRRTGICGATEVLIIDEDIVATHLPLILTNLLESGCEVRAEQSVMELDKRIKKLNKETDFDTEFLDAIIAIKVVTDIHEAIDHISKHGTQHTDAIIAEDVNAAEMFLNSVNSAIVMHNASTQFADGGEFGLGGEIGIATGKLHARGPIGVKQLTTFKYQVRGSGQIRA
jgi:glutamate-5-semialdehyde dehydrogenase